MKKIYDGFKRTLTDSAALDRIWELLDGVEWTADSLEAIAEVVEETGRRVQDPLDVLLQSAPIPEEEEIDHQLCEDCSTCGARRDDD